MIESLSLFDVHVYDKSYRLDRNVLYNDIVGHVQTCFKNYQQDRSEIEAIWLQSWASYLNTPQSNAYLRNRILRTVGNVRSEWRHKINTGKTFEVVETIHSYLMTAFFPNKNWLDIKAFDHNASELARVLRYYVLQKLGDWNFRPQFAAGLRQALITGTSVVAVPWSDKQQIEFNVLDNFDCYYNARMDSTENTPFIRRIRKTRGDIISHIESGYYSNHVDPFEVVMLQSAVFQNNNYCDVEYDHNGQLLHSFRGLPTPATYSMTDRVSLLEFWGDIELPYMTIHNCVVTVMGGKLLRFARNKYKCGKPFVTFSYIPVVKQNYGLSAIQSSLGMIVQLNNSANQMLDGIELAVNPMYTVVEDGVLQLENLETEPGRYIPVQDHDAIRPMQPPANNFDLSFEQLGFLEAAVDKNAGVGPLIGVGQPRGGERVTATEINAVIESGGNRLLGVYTHLQDTYLGPLLRLTLENIRQFTTVDSIVRVPDLYSDAEVYYDVGVPELEPEYDIYPVGSEHVAEREEYISRRVQLLDLILKLPPEKLQNINVDKIIADIIRSTLYEDPESYFTKSPAALGDSQVQQPQQPQIPPMMQQMLQEQMMADSGQQLLSDTLGIQANGQQLSASLANAAIGAAPPASPEQPSSSTGSI